MNKNLIKVNQLLIMIFLQAKKGEICKGDSGGPVMWKNKEGRYILLGNRNNWYYGLIAKFFPSKLIGLYTKVKRNSRDDGLKEDQRDQLCV